ncbi:MAG: hypothetical protein Q9190_000985 [Brigantiaea leucoxantha]
MAASTKDQLSNNGSDAVDSPNELVKAVDELLDNLSAKFSKVSTEVFAKMDEMAQRLDELEASIKAGADASDRG